MKQSGAIWMDELVGVLHLSLIMGLIKFVFDRRAGRATVVALSTNINT